MEHGQYAQALRWQIALPGRGGGLERLDCRSEEPRPREVVRQVQAGGQIAAGIFPIEKPRPPVERIEAERIAEEGTGFAGAAEGAQDHDLEIARAEIVGVETKGAVEMFQGAGPV